MNINTFKNFESIKSLSEYREENPVSTKNYNFLVGDYNFPKKVKCCKQKENGKLCGTEHNHGFVASLTNDTITLIGNCCVEKFDPDTTIHKDGNKYLKIKKIQEKLFQINHLISQEKHNIQRLDIAAKKLKEIKQSITEFSELIGAKIKKRLIEMSRSTNSTVSVKTIKHHKYYENGEQHVEDIKGKIKLGNLDGLEIFNQFTYKPIYESIGNLKRSYKEAKLIDENTKAGEIQRLVNAINEIDRIESQIEKVEQQHQAFFKSDLSLLCFLTHEKAKRYNAAKIILDHIGFPMGKEKAKNWLIDKETKIKMIHKIDRIIIT